MDQGGGIRIDNLPRFGGIVVDVYKITGRNLDTVQTKQACGRIEAERLRDKEFAYSKAFYQID